MQAARGTFPIRRLLFSTAAAGLAADQITKAIAVASLRPGRSVHAVDGILWWTLQRNPGAAFSLFQRIPVAFTVLAIVISVAIVFYASRVSDRVNGVALGLVLAGALGNLGDRLFRLPGPFRGHVIDFIDFRFWPTFNVADMCVVAGAILMFLSAFRRKPS